MERLNVPGPKAKKIVARDSKYISNSYSRAYPFVMDHGKGTEVWDVDGNRYLDFAAGIAVTATGHSHPEVVKAIKEQADKFLHISSNCYHPIWVELAERLDRIAPFGEDAVAFMTNSGTESVEAAIKLARFHTGRTQFIGFLGGFHGRTFGSLAFTASKSVYRHGFYPLMSGVIHAPYPDPYRQILASNKNEPYGETVVRYIEEQLIGKVVHADDIAGILIEPIQGEGGYIVPAEGFFPAIRNLCDKYGILLIADEVQSGMGRTGKWWAIENFDVEPDIVCSAKGIASGIPLGAIIAKASVMTWPEGAHGNTYGGNPIASAAALATIDLIEKEYLKNAVEMGSYMFGALEEIKSSHDSIGDVRGIGLMLGVDFVKNHISKEYNTKLRDKVERLGFEYGLVSLGCGKSTIRFAPPLSITKAEIDEGLKIFDHVIGLAEKGS
ncbi:MAG: acetyl ornithine aminotransferase family protein [Anaerolineales bacterium]|nr:acetyl ornithine aminotransferase family protein [Anaerolineales bacterium]